MIVSCPNCRKKFQLDPSRVIGDWTPLACRHCGTRFVVTVREKTPQHLLDGVVLITASPSPFRDRLETGLQQLGLAVKTVDQLAAGAHYLSVCVPDILVTAAQLGDTNGMELARRVRQDEGLRGCRVWIIGAPADSMAERSFTPDAWIAPTTPPEQLESVLRTAVAPLLAQGEHLTEHERDQRRAERLARTILSDIILYNPEEVEKGIREGNFHELLCEELEDARRYFAEQVHPDVLREQNHFETLLGNYISEQKQKLNPDPVK